MLLPHQYHRLYFEVFFHLIQVACTLDRYAFLLSAMGPHTCSGRLQIKTSYEFMTLFFACNGQLQHFAGELLVWTSQMINNFSTFNGLVYPLRTKSMFAHGIIFFRIIYMKSDPSNFHLIHVQHTCRVKNVIHGTFDNR